MSQLNLQEILGSDDISNLVEKLNYNFNQIVLNGGGPQGLRGIIGAPGLPGLRGEFGPTGTTGADGTYLYADTLSPSLYPFGTGGEALPRVYDIFLETTSTYINVWKYSATGGTGAYWNLIDTVTSPIAGLSKVVADALYTPVGLSASRDSAANDPSIVGKILFASPDAIYGDKIFTGLTSASPTRVPELSAATPYADSLMTLASQKNQLRLINSDPYFLGSDRLFTGGGIAHSVESVYAGATYQIYRIIHADSTGSNNYFSISMSLTGAATSTLLFSDNQHRLAVGSPEFATLKTRLTVDSTSSLVGGLAVGSQTFYSGATAPNSGSVFQGNVAIGRNMSTLATLGIYGPPFGAGTTAPATVVIDNNISSGVATSYSLLGLYGGYYANQSSYNAWNFIHSTYNSPSNPDYGSLKIKGRNSLINNSIQLGTTTLYLGITGTSASYYSFVGVATDTVYEKFQVGDLLTIGNKVSATGPTAHVYTIGFNTYADSSLANRRIIGAVGGTQFGFGRISFIDKPMPSGATYSRNTALGTRISFEVQYPGGTSSSDTSASFAGSSASDMFAGMILVPGGTQSVYSSSSFVTTPVQLRIGLSGDYEPNGSNSLRRGTLQVPMSMRRSPISSTVLEDSYNIGLYNNTGYPIAALGTIGSSVSTYKSVSFSTIGLSGIYSLTGGTGMDVALLTLQSENTSVSADHTQRMGVFGSNTRVGIMASPNATAGYPYRNASLVVGRWESANTPTGLTITVGTATMGSGAILSFSITTGGSNYQIGDVLTVSGGISLATITVTGIDSSGGVTSATLTYAGTGYSSASLYSTQFLSGIGTRPTYISGLFSDSLVVDHTGNSNGGLAIKNWTAQTDIYGTSIATDPGLYYADWLIQYKSFIDQGTGLTVGGLNFATPSHNFSGSTVGDYRFFISDNGSVAIGFGEDYGLLAGTPTLTFATSNPGYRYNAGAYVDTWIPTLGWGPSRTVKMFVRGYIGADAIMVHSDRRMKDDIQPITEALKRVLQLQPKTYYFKGDSSSVDNGIYSAGFIAQDVQSIIPESIRCFPDTNYEGGKLSLDYNSFIPYTVGAIQEQQKIIEDQQAQIKNLEERLAKIEKLLSK